MNICWNNTQVKEPVSENVIGSKKCCALMCYSKVSIPFDRLYQIEMTSQHPAYIVIIPWNIREEIMEQLAYVREWGGQFVTAVPELVIF
jgi:hypothetical protein